jgi:hypothetical protein
LETAGLRVPGRYIGLLFVQAKAVLRYARQLLILSVGHLVYLFAKLFLFTVFYNGIFLIILTLISCNTVFSQLVTIGVNAFPEFLVLFK